MQAKGPQDTLTAVTAPPQPQGMTPSGGWGGRKTGLVRRGALPWHEPLSRGKDSGRLQGQPQAKTKLFSRGQEGARVGDGDTAVGSVYNTEGEGEGGA